MNGTTTAPPFTGWPPAALEWFAGLEAENSRAWFQANRHTYDEAVRQPLESLLAELHEEFGEAKVFRPNRDTRFSKDKTPYKTNVAAVLTPAGLGHLYVELSSRGLFVGGGRYHPEREQLARIRAGIADERAGKELDEVLADLRAAGFELLAEGSLRTAPRGFPADHPRIELLRLVNLAVGRLEKPGRWLHTVEAKDRVVAGWRAVGPLVSWLAAR